MLRLVNSEITIVTNPAYKKTVLCPAKNPLHSKTPWLKFTPFSNYFPLINNDGFYTFIQFVLAYPSLCY